MSASMDLRDSILAAWATNNRVTVYLLENLPGELWPATLPGAPRRTIRMIASHLHNARCMWIKTLGRAHGIKAPANVNRHRVRCQDLIKSLGRSSHGIASLLELGCESGGCIPPTAAYVWRNLPLDVGHVLSYFVAHEGHHRGQIVMLARQLGFRLSTAARGGLWQWTNRSAEARA